MNRKSFFKRLGIAAASIFLPKFFVGGEKKVENIEQSLWDDFFEENHKLHKLDYEIAGESKIDAVFKRNIVHRKIRVGGKPIDLNFFRNMFSDNN